MVDVAPAPARCRPPRMGTPDDVMNLNAEIWCGSGTARKWWAPGTSVHRTPPASTRPCLRAGPVPIDYPVALDWVGLARWARLPCCSCSAGTDEPELRAQGRRKRDSCFAHTGWDEDGDGARRRGSQQCPQLCIGMTMPSFRSGPRCTPRPRDAARPEMPRHTFCF